MPKQFLAVAAFIAALVLGVSAAHALNSPPFTVKQGGTGTSTTPAYGQLLVGGKNGEFEYVASSTMGGVNTVFGRKGTVTAQSGDYTTSLVTEGSNLYFTTARAQAAISAAYPLLYSGGVVSSAYGTTTANAWSALQVFNGAASSSALTVSGNSWLGTILSGTWSATPIGSSYGGAGTVSGILKANGAGVVSAAAAGSDYQAPLTLPLSIANGGGNASSYTAGQLLSYNGTSFVSTSTIGNNQLAHPALTVTAGTGLSGGGTPVLGSSTSLSLNLANANTWTAVQTFGNASSTLTTLGTTWLSGITGSTQCLHVNSAGLVTGTGFDCGSVTSVGASGGTTGLTFSGSPVTGSGSFTLGGTLAAGSGGTGITSPSAAGVLLGSYAGGGWQQVATSSLGLSTTNVSEGTNLYWTNVRFDGRLSATTSLPNITTLAGLSLPLSQTTGTLGVANGGTGSASVPAYGQVLIGTSGGIYSLTATSSLGLPSFGGSNTWTGTNVFTNGIAVGPSSTSITMGSASLAYASSTLWNTSFGLSAGNIAGSTTLSTTPPAYTEVGNTSFGYLAGSSFGPSLPDPLDNLPCGCDNTAVGSLALYSNTTGGDNTAVGYFSMTNIATGNDNTAVGDYTLYNATSSGGNLALGEFSLYHDLGGGANVASGYNALFNNTYGNYNSANSYWSLFSNTTGSNNTAIGSYALYANQTGNGNVAVGYGAGYNATTSNNFFVGNVQQSSLASDKAYSLLYGTFAGVATSTAGQQLTINGALNLATTTAGCLNVSSAGLVYSASCSSGGSVSSISNSDGTLTISPTTGSVVASLNLSHSNTWTSQQVFNNGATGPQSGALNIGRTSASTNAQTIIFANGLANDYDIGRLANSDDLVFGNWTGTAFQERVRFGASGNVGIATTSPFAPLSVAGNAYIGGTLTATGTATLANIIDQGVTANTLLYANGSQQQASASASAPLSFTTGTLSITKANASNDGYLAQSDWSAFNSKVSSTSLSGGTGVAYNSSTGVITNSGVTSNVAGTGISVSGSTGAVTVTNTGVTALSATYPVITSGSAGSLALSLGFSTTTANTWSQAQTFNGNITVTNANYMYFNGLSDGNWRMGRNTGSSGDFTKAIVTNAAMDVIDSGSATEGFAIGANGGNSALEVSGTGNVYSRTNLSIATTTFGSALNVGGVANLTTATSTFYSSGGINIAAGCYAINGSCVGGSGGGSGTVTSVTLATPNSSLSLGGTNPVTMSGTINADLNLANPNWWTARQNFGNASSSQFTATSTVWFTGLTNALLSTDSTGKLVATSSVGTNYLSGALLAAQFPALTGDITTTAGSLATTLKNTGTAGTYRSVTTDAQGRVTSGTNPTTFSGYAISDTSANLAAALTDETGTGFAVFSAAPTFTGTTKLANASSTIESAYTAYFGGTATTSINGAGLLSAPNATSTLFTAGTAWITSVTSALDLNDSNGKVTAYTGSSCTNQFVRSLNGAGMATCAQVNLTLDVTGTLPAGNGGTGATSLSSFFSVASNVLKANEHHSFTYATSTTWTGTTTIPLEVAYGELWQTIRCFTDAGTLNVDVYHASSHLNLLNASTTIGTFGFSTNNTMTSGDTVKVDIGTPASAPTRITCTETDQI